MDSAKYLQKMNTNTQMAFIFKVAQTVKTQSFSEKLTIVLANSRKLEYRSPNIGGVEK